MYLIYSCVCRVFALKYIVNSKRDADAKLVGRFNDVSFFARYCVGRVIMTCINDVFEWVLLRCGGALISHSWYEGLLIKSVVRRHIKIEHCFKNASTF